MSLTNRPKLNVHFSLIIECRHFVSIYSRQDLADGKLTLRPILDAILSMLRWLASDQLVTAGQLVIGGQPGHADQRFCLSSTEAPFELTKC
jgi:hypothetical protein